MRASIEMTRSLYMSYNQRQTESQCQIHIFTGYMGRWLEKMSLATGIATVWHFSDEAFYILPEEDTLVIVLLQNNQVENRRGQKQGSTGRGNQKCRMESLWLVEPIGHINLNKEQSEGN